jgi:glycerol-3-phosphate acyltransferase PlsX
MSIGKTTIAVDVMGGENAPLKNLKGIEIFSKKNNEVAFVLLGVKKKIVDVINSQNIKISNYEILNTFENITNDDNASTILRKRKDSSIYRGLELVRDFKVSGFVSAGNTAALMILSRSILGMIDGIDRPAICSIIPNKKDFSIILDLGANSTVVAKNLLQFALMGYCYHGILKPDIEPRIGIINIGTENNKGLEFLKEAAELINDSFLKKNFIGFVEPNKITSGICDVMVSDGYTGNIMLKTAEGMSKFITDNLKNVFMKSLKNKLAYKILESDLKNFKDLINPEKYNGATLIGVNGISIKSHGGASPFAFSSAIQRCYEFINNDINKKIRQNFDFL